MNRTLLTILAAGALVLFGASAPLSNTAPSQTPAGVRQDAPSGIPPQTNSEGNIEVIVQPKNLSTSSSTWEFDVTLDTHSVELSEDMVKVSELVDDTGKVYQSFKWQGDPPGGHHRKGTLSFQAIAPVPRAFELRIKGLGGIPARSFQWIRR